MSAERRNSRVNGQSRYRLANGARTSNEAEAQLCAQLERDGWEVMKRGWPDFLAVRGDSVRFIEVKPYAHRDLSPHQRRVRDVLRRFGIEVERWVPTRDAAELDVQSYG